jgi:hypothetical protein
MKAPYLLEYTFIAECVNGSIIKQTPDDKSFLDPTRSAHYDLRMNLPLKTFTLVGKGNTFCVDFTDLAIVINGKRHYNPKKLPAGAKISLIYWRNVIQISENTLVTEKGLLSGIKKRFYFAKHKATIPKEYTIGWEAHDQFTGKKITDWVTKIQ